MGVRMRKLPDLDQITAFLAVAEGLSFRRAAERLAIDQSALSRRIKDLEHRVGCQLLHRTTHAVRLTDAGRSFYDANFTLVRELSQAIERANRIAQGQSGSLRIAYMTFAAIRLVPEAIRAFSAAHPDVAVALTYERTQAQKLSLARGEIDIGVMLGPFAHSDFATAVLAEEPLVALMPAGHRLTARDCVTLGDLAREPLVLGDEAQWDFYREIVADAFAAKGLKPRIGQEAPSLTGIVGLVLAGLGVTLVPAVMATACPQGLVTRPITDAERTVTTLAVWRRPGDEKIRDMVAMLEASDGTGPPLAQTARPMSA